MWSGTRPADASFLPQTSLACWEWSVLDMDSWWNRSWMPLGRIPRILASPNFFFLKLLMSYRQIRTHTQVQWLSRVRLFATPWIAARQASLSITNSRSSLRLNVHRVGYAIRPSHPLSSPSPAHNPSQHESFPMSQLFAWGGQSTLEFQL